MSSGQYELDFRPRPRAEAKALKADRGFELHEPRRCPRCRAVTFKAPGSSCFICVHFPKLAEGPAQ